MIYKLTAGLALAVTGVWAISRPDWDSICAALAALAALVAGFVVQRAETGQSQNVGASSVGVQAGRDATVRDINNNTR